MPFNGLRQWYSIICEYSTVLKISFSYKHCTIWFGHQQIWFPVLNVLHHFSLYIRNPYVWAVSTDIDACFCKYDVARCKYIHRYLRQTHLLYLPFTPQGAPYFKWCMCVASLYTISHLNKATYDVCIWCRSLTALQNHTCYYRRLTF